jgi:uncharacterized DUF497 family protein
MLFEWDERKRQSNLAKHHIDFQDAIRIFENPIFENPIFENPIFENPIFENPIFEKTTRSRGEDRVLAIGLLEDIEIVVVYVIRGKRRRIISARRAHRDERQDYANHLTLPRQRRH